MAFGAAMNNSEKPQLPSDVCAHDWDFHWAHAKGACIKCGAECMKAVYVEDKEPHQLAPGEWCSWDAIIYAHCPGPGKLVANLGGHTTTIPSRGVLSVSPSILCTDGSGGHRFHGFIENGVWLGEDRQPVMMEHA